MWVTIEEKKNSRFNSKMRACDEELEKLRLENAKLKEIARRHAKTN